LTRYKRTIVLKDYHFHRTKLKVYDLECLRCKKKFKVGDKIVTFSRGKGGTARRYHVECYEMLFYDT